jgi:hypothetical protein
MSGKKHWKRENQEKGASNMTEIPYRQEGDYLVPDLKLTDATERPIGKYGRMRKTYLQNHRRGLYSALLLSGKLMEHLADTEEEAQEQIETIIAEMLKLDPAPDKGTDQMGWVRHMNSLRMTAEEIVTRELVYS